jgi:hypothetical protein
MLSALPGYFDNSYISDPARNLAGLSAAPGSQPYPTPAPQLYRAYDGTPIGYSKGCDPISAEPMLSGLDFFLPPKVFVPDILTDNRVEFGEQWGLPLLAATVAYHQGMTPLQTALWSLGAYVAPLPAAGLLAFQLTRYGRMGRPAFAGLGQAWDKYKRGWWVQAKREGGPAWSPIRWARPGPWQEKRRCIRLKRVWDARRGKNVRRCAQYSQPMLPPAAFRPGDRGMWQGRGFRRGRAKL